MGAPALKEGLSNAIFTVRDVVDDTGAVVKSFEFNEHGLEISSSGSGTFSPKTYQGGLSVNDDTADSGLYLMGNRHFESALLGRFISRDPIGFAGGLNLFNGHSTSPVTMVDPSGLDNIELHFSEQFTSMLAPGGIDQIAFSVQQDTGIPTTAVIGLSKNPGFGSNGIYIQNIEIDNTISGWGNTPPSGIWGLSEAGSTSKVNYNKIAKGIKDYRKAKPCPSDSSEEEMIRAFFRKTAKHEIGHGLTGWAGHPRDGSIMDDSTLGKPGGGIYWGSNDRFPYGSEAVEAIKVRLNIVP